MAIREGVWDCSSCGQTNRGRDKICQSCGNPKDDSEKFYLPENAPALTDQKLLQQAKAGPDWHCSFCGSANTGDRPACKQCGATIGDSKHNEVKDLPPAPPPEPPGAPPTRPPQDRTPRAPRPKSHRLLIGLLIAAALVTGGLYLLLATSDVEVTLTGLAWQREISIEKNTLVQEEDWDLPVGGELVNSYDKVHHNDQVLDHYETKTRSRTVQTGSNTEEYTCGTIDKGNGFFEDKICAREEPIYETVEEEYQDPVYRDEPSYQTWYVYKIWRWKPERTESAAGQDLDPYWPDPRLADKERESGRKENYQAEFTDPDGDTHQLTFPSDRWGRLKKGETYTGQMNALGILRGIEDKP